jgi:hypothetical protein
MNYQGEDLIIVTGAPGSRWSGVIRLLSLICKDINMTDNTPRRVYEKRDAEGKVIGWHRGAYWGPHNQYGHKFDMLNTLSKEEVLKEFKEPFADWDTGKKIIKSHWFAYHLPQLRQMFPKATMWSFYEKDKECFDWWHHVGGWDIYFPNYTWYVNDDRMMQQINIENSNIKDFFNLKRFSGWKEAVESLGLSTDIRTISEILELDPDFDKIHKNDNEEVYNAFLDEMFTRKEMGVITS